MNDKIYHITLTSVTGAVILAHQSRKSYTGTVAQLEAAYKKVLIHNLTLGWWGLVSIIWNTIAIVRNYKMRQSLYALRDAPEQEKTA